MQDGFLVRDLSFGKVSTQILTTPDLLRLDENGWCVIHNADECKLMYLIQQ